MRWHHCALAFATSSAVLIGGAAQADPVEDFYRGKTITLIVGFSPGGTYDATARLLAKDMPEHMPGKPAMVVQNLLGAGAINAVLHLYNSAPRDGTVIGMPPRGYATAPFFNDQLKYDARRFNALGSTTSEVAAAVTWHTVPVKRIEDAFTREITVGATAYFDDTGTLPLMTQHLTGAKIRLVTGYPGGNDITTAMEKGEVDARFGWSWGSVKSRARKWLDDKTINVILQMGVKKAPDLPDTPFIMDYAKTDRDKKAMELLMAPQAFAWPFVTPPEVPADRLAALRRAFDATMKDPSFIADAKKIDIEVDAMTGEAMQALIERVLSFDQAVIARAQELVKPPS
jgi:tripartite-type tricarboxylate transporter receptor subunit TctC